MYRLRSKKLVRRNPWSIFLWLYFVSLYVFCHGVTYYQSRCTVACFHVLKRAKNCLLPIQFAYLIGFVHVCSCTVVLSYYRECKSDTVFIRVYVSVENTPGELLLLQFRLFNKRNDVCSMRPFRVINNDGLNNHTYGRLVVLAVRRGNYLLEP